MNIRYFFNLGLKNPRGFAEAMLRQPMITGKLSDKQVLKLLYRLRFKRFPNFEKPETFNEKLCWLILNNRNPLYNLMVDKYEAKQYVNNVLTQSGCLYDCIIPTYGIYEKFEDIDFVTLPDQFVIKTTHDSGCVTVVIDKSQLDIDSLKTKINKSLQYNYYWFSREWVYKDVQPRIIIEKLLVAGDKSGDLKDYKVFCFNGQPEYVKVDYDRFSDHHANYYDFSWNLQDWGEVICPPVYDRELPPPQLTCI